MNYLGGREASRLLGVHQRTLYLWDKKGKIKTIRTPGNKRLYDVSEFINEKIPESKMRICYVRVSSNNQKDDLRRQEELMKIKCPEHEIIRDIGSGINFNRKGLRRIIKLAIEGRIKELVVFHKDRLTRFGFELIEDLIREYSNGEIIVINRKDKLEPQEELVLDVLQILNVFTAKMNGLRKYKQ